MRYWSILLLILSFCSFASDMPTSTINPVNFSYLSLMLLSIYLLIRTKKLHKQSVEQAQDIAEHTQMLQHKSATIHSLQKQNKNLFASTSDEFRTPLTLILGPLESMLKNEADKNKKAQMSSIKRNGQRLLQMIDRMQEQSMLDDPCMSMADSECSKNATVEVTKTALNQKELQFVERFEAIVAQNYQSTDFNRSQTASLMAISDRQLNRKLSDLTDHNFSCYLRKYRLRQAVCLLGKGLQVSQIGDRVGFSSTTYFSSCFKSEFGKTVKQYEQQLKGQ